MESKNSDANERNDNLEKSAEVKDGAENPDGKDTAKERINNHVAVTVAILAVFMAVTKVVDDNVCQQMIKEKTDEVNAWGQYQGKSIKQNLSEFAAAQLAGLALMTTGDARAQIDMDIKTYQAEKARYETEKEEIYTRATTHGEKYKALNSRDDQFDSSDALLSMALGLLAVTALTGKRSLLVGSWVMGSLGALIGVGGLLKLDWVRPDWLAKLLS